MHFEQAFATKSDYLARQMKARDALKVVLDVSDAFKLTIDADGREMTEEPKACMHGSHGIALLLTQPATLLEFNGPQNSNNSCWIDLFIAPILGWLAFQVNKGADQESILEQARYYPELYAILRQWHTPLQK